MTVVCLDVPYFWDIFYLTLVEVLFMVDEKALEEVFIRVLRLFLVHGIPSMLHNHSFIYHRCYIILAPDSPVKLHVHAQYSFFSSGRTLCDLVIRILSYIYLHF